MANIFELLHPIYLVFSGRRPLGSKRSEKLLREPDVKSADVARQEVEITPLLEGLDPRELDDLVEQINKANRQKTAASRRGTTKTFRRNPVLSAALKIKYSDKCQICGVTFKSTRGRFFTDTHHLRALKEGGTDTSDNIAVVCPNHHRILERSAVKVVSRTQETVVIETSGKLFEIIVKRIID
jgi:predicted restriction endonuclease